MDKKRTLLKDGIPTEITGEDTAESQKPGEGGGQPVFMLFAPDTKPEDILKAVQEAWDKQPKAEAEKKP